LPVLVIGGQSRRCVPADVVAAEQGRLDGAVPVDRAQRAQRGRAVGGEGAAAAGPRGPPRRRRPAPLVGSINRYLGEDLGLDAGAQVGAEAGGGLTITDSRPAGGAWLLDGLWRQLGITTALREVLGRRRFTTDVERVIFALVANRALGPASKLAAADWVTHDVAIPGLAGMAEHQAYRAMDLLVEADTDACVQEAVFRRRCSSPWRTCSTSRSTCCSSTPPVPTSSGRPRTPTRRPTPGTPPGPAALRGSGATGTARTPVPICRRSSSAWP
jgi:hypothetical protein